VHAKNVLVDQRGEWKQIEDIGAHIPQARVAVVEQALLVEAVSVRDLAAFVIPA
jgi:flagellar biosynthesis component FlhA